jgi:hypothetical protein
MRDVCLSFEKSRCLHCNMNALRASRGYYCSCIHCLIAWFIMLYSFQETNKPLVINCTLVYPCHRLKQLQLVPKTERITC